MMLRNYIFLVLLLCSYLTGYAQSVRPVDLVKQHQHTSIHSNPISPFVAHNAQASLTGDDQEIKLPEELSDYTVLQLSNQPLQSFAQAQKYIEVTLPKGDENLELQLVEVDLYGDVAQRAFELPSNKPAANSSEKYYRGIIKGQETSLVALSITNDEISGFIAQRGGERLQLGKLKNQDKHILYNSAQLNPTTTSCHTSDDTDLPQQYSTPTTNINNTNTTNEVPVELYIEVDYNVYTSKGRSISQTTNFINAAMNQVMTMFANENINTVLQPLYIWTSSSPYAGSNAGEVLEKFRATRTDFDGHLGGLLTKQPIGGVATVAGLCRSNKSYSIMASEVEMYNYDLPNYSFNTDFITHEFGHLFGSKHTHACAWNGNNTPIDGCYAPQGDCDRGPSVSKGTVMSYCHLSVGTDLTLGFGPQPGDVIRNNVFSASCLGITATPDTVIDTDNDNVNDITDLDNDNDGILDTVECTEVKDFNFTIGDGGGTRTFATNSNLYKAVVDLNTIDNSVQIKVNGTPIDRIYEMENGALSTINEYLLATESGNFTAPWVANRNGLPRLRVTIFHDGSVALEGTASYNSTSLEPVLRINGGEIANVQFTDNTTISVVNPNEGGLDGVTGSIKAYVKCDTDGDGIDNRLDKDSDNDGCIDALEGGQNIASSAINTTTQNLGNTVNNNGVPTIAGNGQSIGSALNAGVQDDECEAVVITPPSTPQNLTVSNIAERTMTLSWAASTDEDGSVSAYKLFVNGSLVNTVSVTNVNLQGFTPNTTYTFKVIAVDNDGNESAPAQISATTLEEVISIDDMDGDGVADENDLDNDNDGILDSDEIIKETNEYTFSIGNGGGTKTFSQTYANKVVIDFNTIDNSLLVKYNGVNIDRIYETESGALSSSNEYLLKVAGSNYYRPWDPNRNGLPRLRMIIDTDGSIELLGTRSTTSTTLETVTRTGASSTPSITFVENSTFTIQNFNEGGPDGLTGKLTIISSNNDADNDGIENRFDLDSDNDGCLDATEGSASISQSDLISSSLAVGNGSSATPLNLGTNVDSNGVPTIVSGGQEIGSALNASIKECGSISTPEEEEEEEEDNSCYNIKVELLSDNFPEETTWTLTNSNGDVVLQNGTLGKNTLYVTEECLPNDCYTFTIKDRYFDGICCNYGEGYYQVSVNGQQIATGGNFGGSDTKNFCTDGSAAMPTATQQPRLNNQPKYEVYPNPVYDGVLFINLNEARETSYRVYNISGKELLKGQLNFGKNSINIDQLQHGVYFIQVSDYKETKTSKFIVK